MKVFSRHISYFALLPALLLSSCIYDVDNCDEPTQRESLKPRMALNIMPVSMGVANADVTEMISSLRIVILSETTDEESGETTSYVEYNEYFDFAGEIDNGMFSGPGEVANTFRFIITRNTVPGLKKFYLIANENRVTPISFQDVTSLPEGIENGMMLHDFLNYYSADYIADLDYPETGTKPEEGAPKGAEFETLVNTIYYTPEFTQIQQDISTGTGKRNVIFLPYTSFYTYQLASKSDIDSGKAQGAVNILDGNMYLIPAATKFRFEFQNYRPDPVVIPSFKLAGMASDMYLFAQVYGNDLNKDFGDKKNLWWVDWLANVSAASQAYPNPDDNLAFSSAFGWMNLYNIPDDAFDYDTEGDIMDNALRKGVIELVEDPDNPWEVPANTSGNSVQGPPGYMYTDYYYLPESRYMVDFPMYDDNGDFVKNESLQAYYLKLYMISGPNADLSAVKDTQIGNLGSLFRNTRTYITIKMRDALDVGAYAQLEPWDESHTNGTVQEEPSDEY